MVSVSPVRLVGGQSNCCATYTFRRAFSHTAKKSRSPRLEVVCALLIWDSVEIHEPTMWLSFFWAEFMGSIDLLNETGQESATTCVYLDRHTTLNTHDHDHNHDVKTQQAQVKYAVQLIGFIFSPSHLGRFRGAVHGCQISEPVMPIGSSCFQGLGLASVCLTATPGSQPTTCKVWYREGEEGQGRLSRGHLPSGAERTLKRVPAAPVLFAVQAAQVSPRKWLMSLAQSLLNYQHAHPAGRRECLS